MSPFRPIRPLPTTYWFAPMCLTMWMEIRMYRRSAGPSNGQVQSTTGAVLNSGFVGGDTVTCEVSPRDGQSTGTTVSSSVVIDNSVPEVSGVNVSCSGTCQAEDTLTCSYTYSDLDGQSDASTIEWTNGTTTLGTGATLGEPS